MQSTNAEPVKDPDRAHPLPEAWRPVLRKVVRALAGTGSELSSGMASVAPISPATLAEMRHHVADYGETLIDLPDDVWITSVSQWMGTHWDVLLDLWTRESGRSDMVLSVRVFEVAGEYRFDIDSVYVP